MLFPPTIIFRHNRENLKKCSLSGLEKNADFIFHTYPKDPLPKDIAHSYILLSFEGPLLSIADQPFGLLLIDGTWKYAEKMQRQLHFPKEFKMRSLPTEWRTAYPRRQLDCSLPERGLSSVEALFAAFHIVQRNPNGLLDHYHWKEDFLKKNAAIIENSYAPR